MMFFTGRRLRRRCCFFILSLPVLHQHNFQSEPLLREWQADIRRVLGTFTGHVEQTREIFEIER